MITIPAKCGDSTVSESGQVVVTLHKGRKYLNAVLAVGDQKFELKSEVQDGLSGILEAFLSAKKPDFLRGRAYRDSVKLLANGVVL